MTYQCLADRQRGSDQQLTFPLEQYLRQLRKAEGGLSGMNTTQAGDLIENFSQ